MQKDFDKWNRQKKNIHNFNTRPVPFHERDIWWCYLGLNIGDEQDGKSEIFERPVLVLKKFNKQLAWVLPLSTKVKDNKYYHVINHNGILFSVILSQMRMTSAKRFSRFRMKLGRSEFRLIVNKIKYLL